MFWHVAKTSWEEDFGVEIIQLPEEDIKKARSLAAELIVDFGKKSPEAEEYVKIYAEVLNDLGYIDIAESLGYDK